MKLISEENVVVHHCTSAAASRRTVSERDHSLTRKITPNGSFGSQEQYTCSQLHSQLHSQLCSQLKGKMQQVTFRARRYVLEKNSCTSNGITNCKAGCTSGFWSDCLRPKWRPPRSNCGSRRIPTTKGKSKEGGCTLRKLRLRGFLALLHRQEELEFWRQLLLRVEAVGEIDATQPAVRVDLNTQCLDVVRAVRTAREIRQVELDLIPALVKTHWHGADEWLHPRRRLVV